MFDYVTEFNFLSPWIISFRLVIPNSTIMSTEDSSISETLESQTDDTLKSEIQLVDTGLENDANHVKENGLFNGMRHIDSTHDQLVQMVVELNLQNEYLKSQLLQAFHSESDGSPLHAREAVQEGGAVVDVKELHEKIESLGRELFEEKQTRVAAEEALKHLRAAHLEADAKVQELSTKLAEGQILSPSFSIFCYFLLETCLIVI